MLQYIRERAQGWLAWIIIGMLIIPFALWGINQYFQGGGESVVATVNGKEISHREYQQMFQQQRERIRGMLGKNANAELVESLVKPKDVLEGLIEQELLAQAAANAGFRVGEGLLAEQIKGIEAFQHDGKFSKELYENYLRNVGLTHAGFESKFARSATIEQLNEGYVDTSIVTKSEIENHIRSRDQKRDIGYLVIAATPFEGAVDASDSKVKEYYESHRDKFVQPEQVSLEYVELSTENFLNQVQSSADEVQAYYEEHKKEYGVPEQRRARHILITADKGKDAEAEKKAQEVLARLKKGESFETLAKQLSQDPGSAAKGGDLGFFGPGIMDPAFEKATYALKIGELSPIVKTSFGYHIIKLDEIRAGSLKPLNDVRAEIERAVKTSKAETKFFDQSEKLATLAYEKPDSLQPLATELGLKIQTTPFVTHQGGAGIASNPKVVAAAFKDEVLKKGLNSEPIEVGTNHLVVIRVKEHKPESQRAIEEVRDQVLATVKRELAVQKAEDMGKAVLKRVDAGEDPAVVAKEMKLDWKTASVGRNDAALERALAEHVFKMGRPAGKPINSGVKLNNGDYAVVRLTAVKDGDAKLVDDAQRKSLRENLATTAADSEYSAFINSLKKQAKIARYENKL